MSEFQYGKNITSPASLTIFMEHHRPLNPKPRVPLNHRSGESPSSLRPSRTPSAIEFRLSKKRSKLQRHGKSRVAGNPDPDRIGPAPGHDLGGGGTSPTPTPSCQGGSPPSGKKTGGGVGGTTPLPGIE